MKAETVIAKVEVNLGEKGGMDAEINANLTQGFALAAFLVNNLAKRAGVSKDTAVEIIRKGVNALNEN